MLLGLMLCGVPAMATSGGVEFEQPGWYQRTKTDGGVQYQYFPNGHPVAQSEWSYCESCGNDPMSPVTPNGATVSGYYEGSAWEYNSDDDRSNHGYGNDYAFAESDTMVGGEMETFADAEGYSHQRVEVGKHWVDGWCIFPGHWETDYEWQNIPNMASEKVRMEFVAYDGNVQACSFDTGLFSKSSAKAELGNSFVKMTGEVEGRGGEDEYISSRIIFGGNLYEKTMAQEVGYDGGFGVAYQDAGLSFRMDMPVVEGEIPFVGHLNSNDITIFGIPVANFGPEATVEGFSTVRIDPYGNNRSLVAHTENSTYVGFDTGGLLNCVVPQPETVLSNVGGGGYVNGAIFNGPSYGAGYADFVYSGYTQGNGMADLNIVVNNGFNSTSVIINGSSSAVANGFGVTNNQ